MAKWLSIAPEERAAVVEEACWPWPAPYPTISASVTTVKAWAAAQGITWRWQDKAAVIDAYIAARYAVTTPPTATERKANQ